MKKYLDKLQVFKINLQLLAVFAKRPFFNLITRFLTSTAANLTIRLKKPKKSIHLESLANSWKELMPADGQHLFTVAEIDEETAFVEIHLDCPLRGTNNTNACYRLMNYDRKLLEKIGGELVVVESQANPNISFCKLAIRKKGADMTDLVAAHQNLELMDKNT